MRLPSVWKYGNPYQSRGRVVVHAFTDYGYPHSFNLTIYPPNETAANATHVYVVKWMGGVSFDLEKSAVKTHHANLRKLGIDIARPYDPSFNFSVKVGGSAD
ncbi:phage/plasmid replication protein [Pseudomonas sp. BP01]|uniref:phage/plasmid replication domain-containing protein n=1 Tax=Pseudomonas sp. BP01 TaxID=2976152 RepID=UPI0038620971